MDEYFEVIPHAIRFGPRPGDDGEDFLELQFIDEDGRTAAVLFDGEGFTQFLYQIDALRIAAGRGE